MPDFVTLMQLFLIFELIVPMSTNEVAHPNSYKQADSGPPILATLRCNEQVVGKFMPQHGAVIEVQVNLPNVERISVSTCDAFSEMDTIITLYGKRTLQRPIKSNDDSFTCAPHSLVALDFAGVNKKWRNTKSFWVHVRDFTDPRSVMPANENFTLRFECDGAIPQGVSRVGISPCAAPASAPETVCATMDRFYKNARVFCCSMDGSTCSIGPGGNRSLPYELAESVCRSSGNRLCTEKELVEDQLCCHDEAIENDRFTPVWSSSNCDTFYGPAPPSVFRGARGDDNEVLGELPSVPGGSCSGSCGGLSQDNLCRCSPACVTLGSCCSDYVIECLEEGGCVKHEDCSVSEFCNDSMECEGPCETCESTGKSIDGVCPSCSDLCAAHDDCFDDEYCTAEEVCDAPSRACASLGNGINGTCPLRPDPDTRAGDSFPSYSLTGTEGLRVSSRIECNQRIVASTVDQPQLETYPAGAYVVEVRLEVPFGIMSLYNRFKGKLPKEIRFRLSTCDSMYNETSFDTMVFLFDSRDLHWKREVAFGDDNAQCETFPKSDQIEYSVRVDELPASLFAVVMGSDAHEEGVFSLSMECSVGVALHSNVLASARQWLWSAFLMTIASQTL